MNGHTIRFVACEASFIFASNIPDAAKVTLMQLRGLALERGSKTGLTMFPAEFEERTGKAKSTLHGHLVALRTYGVLRFTTSRRDTWAVVFGDSALDSRSEFLEPNNSNNNNFNFLIPDSDSSPESKGIIDARGVERIYQTVTGLFTIPSKYREAVGVAIFAIADRLGGEAQTVEYLKPYWEAWIERGYLKQNCNWVTEWAVTGEIPVWRGKKANQADTGDEWR